MRRLFVQVYVSFVLVLIISVVSAGLAAWYLNRDSARFDSTSVAVMTHLANDIDPANSDLPALANDLHLDLTLWSADGQVLATTIDAEPFTTTPTEGWHGGRDRGIYAQRSDGAWLRATMPGAQRNPAQLLLLLAVLAAAIGIGCYPLARRLTRHLDAVRTAVKRWGDGELNVRAPTTGTSEVAAVARSFNQAADQVQHLMQGQRRMLTSASHELRSPLARLRLALTLVEDGDLPRAARQHIAHSMHDVTELDALIEDLLLGGRLRAGTPLRSPVDLLGIAAEEASRVNAQAEGESVVVEVDAGATRRMVRNLVENAVRYGGEDVLVRVYIDGDAIISVLDRGPGVPEQDVSRIFEPFYRPTTHAESQGGVGLGLALVREIAEHHGGSVSYRAREHGGSHFEVRLPLAGA